MGVLEKQVSKLFSKLLGVPTTPGTLPPSTKSFIKKYGGYGDRPFPAYEEPKPVKPKKHKKRKSKKTKKAKSKLPKTHQRYKAAKKRKAAKRKAAKKPATKKRGYKKAHKRGKKK